jgi:hypothetical protein
MSIIVNVYLMIVLEYKYFLYNIKYVNLRFAIEHTVKYLFIVYFVLNVIPIIRHSKDLANQSIS